MERILVFLLLFLFLALEPVDFNCCSFSRDPMSIV